MPQANEKGHFLSFSRSTYDDIIRSQATEVAKVTEDRQMKATIYCKATDKGVHTFYLAQGGEEYFLSIRISTVA